MRLLVFDTETTGLTHHPLAHIETQPRIIEFAAVVLDSSCAAIVEEFEQLIHPMESVSEEITKITGITNDMLAGKPNFGEVAPRIDKLFASIDIAIAHNYQFDESMLRNDLTRHGIGKFSWPRRGVCTVQLYVEEFGRGLKLTDLYEQKLGKRLAQTHRALDDVKALAEIVLKEKLWEIFPN